MNVKLAKLNKILKARLKDYQFRIRFYGFAFATWDLLWWFCFYVRPSFSWWLSTCAIQHKTAWLDRYIEKKYSAIIDRYKSDSAPNKSNVSSQTIWFFWGQGSAEMPILVKACYKQLTELNENVILVTTKNLENYLNLPKVIYDKVENGIISWAHFSDIIRTSLLAKYGGLWLDATVWITREFPFNKFENYSFYSANGLVRKSNRSIRFWTSFQWNWSTWCMYASYPNTTLFSFVSTMLQAFAIQEDYWPDYVFQDYLIYYACRNFPQVRTAMVECNKINFNNRNRLAELMNTPYNDNEYKKLTASDYIFKLSFRSHWEPQTSAGHSTYFGKLIYSKIR